MQDLQHPRCRRAGPLSWPQPSDVSEILNAISDKGLCAVAGHGEVDGAVQQIQRLPRESAMSKRHPLSRASVLLQVPNISGGSLFAIDEDGRLGD